MTGRTKAGALALLTVLGLGAAGCTGEPPAAGPSPAAGLHTAPPTPSHSPAPTPREKLLASVGLLTETSMKVDFMPGPGTTVSAVVDPRTKQFSATMVVTEPQRIHVDAVGIGDDIWITARRTVKPTGSQQWLHTRRGRQDTGMLFDLFSGPDPGGLQATLRGLVDVRMASVNGFQGRLDATSSPMLRVLPKAVRTTIGQRAGSVRFFAGVDERTRRLTRFGLRLDEVAAGRGAVEVRFSDFGTPVSVRRPPAKQVSELADAQPDLLGG